MSATHTEIILGEKLSEYAGHREIIKLAKSNCKIVNWTPQRRKSNTTHLVYLLTYFEDLSQEWEVLSKKLLGEKRFVLFRDNTPIESYVELITKLDIRSAKRLHVANLHQDTEHSFLKRFLFALNNDHESIMDAWWDKDIFHIISPQMERLSLPVDIIPKIRNADQTKQRAFEIDSYGSYIYWPKLNVHMGWQQFQQLIDPQALLRAQQKSDQFNKTYGQAIRVYREECNLKQSDIANLDPRTIRRIEKGETRATSKAIAYLAKAHGINPNIYMNEIAKRQMK